MEVKNNKASVIWLGILSLLVLGLGGYIVYDKVLLDKPTNENDSENNAKDDNSNETDGINNENQNNNNDNEKRTYTYDDFIGEYEYRKYDLEVSSKEFIYTVILSSDKTFILYFPNGYTGTRYGIKGTFEIKNNVLTIEPTTHLYDTENEDPLINHLESYKNTSLAIHDKNTLILTTFNGLQFGYRLNRIR